MGYLVNPAGRLVAIDTEEETLLWLQRPGFRRATPEEQQTHIKSRTLAAKEMNEHVGMAEGGIYMATVSQGGKDGYGVSSAHLLEELQAMGVNITTHNNGQKIALLYHNPYSLLRLEAPYRVLYTMFESDKLPDDWKDYLAAADKIIVPSKWCAETFKRAGFHADVIPLGYNDKIFKYQPRENKREKRQDFVFLHYNAFNVRKGFMEVFEAFNKAFQKDEPVKMIFKTTLEDIPLPITKSEYPNIDIIRGKTSEQELAELCWRSDCFVFPSRGEGFGMTPLEAMATGMSAIVPNAHGITEYFDPEYMYEVKVKEMCPAIYSRYKNQDVGKMVVCDVDDLARQMRYVYDHQDEAREMGRKASEYVKNWTFNKTAQQLKALFDNAMLTDVVDKPLRNILELELVR